MAAFEDEQFRIADPAIAAIRWVHNEHMPGAHTPLEVDARELNNQPGPHGLPTELFVNGFAYYPERDIAQMPVPRDATPLGRWRERWLPEIAALAAECAAFDPAAVPAGGWLALLRAQQQQFWGVFGSLHMDTMLYVLTASHWLTEAYVRRFGEARRADGFALLEGFDNVSTDRAVALWALGRIAAGSATVRDAVAGGRPPDGDAADAHAFRAQFAAFLDAFGNTTRMHLADLPTWREDPSVPLAMIAALADEPDDHDPRLAHERNRARREALEQELRAAITADPRDDDAELLRVLPIAQQLLPVSEDHHQLGDQVIIAAGRVRWLRIGQYLVERGLLAEAGDVFYLHIDELVGALEHGTTVPQATLDARRAAVARWRSITPPTHIGTHAVAIAAAAGTSTGAVRGGARELRGIGASAGTYRGRARVIASVNDAARLEAGDVLVCPATAPEWTPYFGVIGALVTNVGGVLTHAAVVAREFRIPAVVGAAGATVTIPDGAMVLVDGSTGVVIVESIAAR